MLRRVNGAEHPSVSLTLNDLGLTLFQQGNLEEAELNLRQALEMRRKQLGDYHDRTGDTFAILRDLLREIGELTEAEFMARRAYACKKKVLGSSSVDFTRLLAILHDEGKAEEAELLFQNEMSELRDRLPANELARILNAYSSTLMAHQLFAQAEPLIREYLAIQERALPDDWRTSSARSLLGGSLIGQKRYTEAEPLLVSGYAGMKQHENLIPATARLRLWEALARLVAFYQTTGDLDRLSLWRSESVQWCQRESESDNAKELNGLAWVMATSADPSMRDGVGATILAEKAAALTERKDPGILDTLAAAYAEAGRFARAVTVQQEAIATVPGAEQKKEFAVRLKLYEANRPCRSP